MPSNHAFASRTRPGSWRCHVRGHDVPIEHIDGALTANRKLTRVVAEPAEKADGSPLVSWSAVFAALMEGFVLYGASVHPNALFPIERFPVNHNVSQPDEGVPLRGPGAVVPCSANPGEAGPHLERATNCNMAGKTGATSVDAGLVGFDGVTSVGIVRSNARSCWNLIAGLWTYWRGEREIRKAVRALAEFDDRTLRDIGIQHWSMIEQSVRSGRDC